LPLDLALRFPQAASFLLRQLQRLPTESRLRHALLRLAFRQGIEALNRGDFDAVFFIWAPDAEFVPVKVEALGLKGTRGRDERIRFQQRWVADWGGFRFEPDEIIDLGDDRRVMWVGRTTSSGLSSGATVDSECAVLLTLSDGWVKREEVFFDHALAFEAAGLER
jgi:ketosteroid isomerase-like protein